MKRILIVDDHAVVRGGLRQFLASTDDLEIASEAATGFDALALISGGDWDLVLLDMSLPDLNGLEVLSGVTSRSQKAPHESLSRREMEVLLLLSKGRALPRIGDSILSTAALSLVFGYQAERLTRHGAPASRISGVLP